VILDGDVDSHARECVSEGSLALVSWMAPFYRPVVSVITHEFRSAVAVPSLLHTSAAVFYFGTGLLCFFMPRRHLAMEDFNQQ
jgi:hypothetical protein